MSPLEAAWKAVLAAPDDDQALHVLADALMEQGDPHGELIRLQLAGDEEGTARHLSTHGLRLLGSARALNEASLQFKRGFIFSARVERLVDLQSVFDRPVSRLVREVRVSAVPVIAELGPIDQIVSEVATRGPRTISSLRFGTDQLAYVAQPGEVQVAPMAARLTSLEELWITEWAARFEGSSSASLRRLRLNLRSPIRGLGEARFPALEALDLELPFRRMELPVALLAGEVAPGVESLTLRGVLWPEQLRDLSVSALLRDLKGLVIVAEAETAWYPALLETIDAFEHLERLELIADRHHPEWVIAVKAALPRAIIREPRLRL